MWLWKHPGRLAFLGTVLLSAGCNLSITPWTKPAAPLPPSDPAPVGPHGQPLYSGPARSMPPNLGVANEATSELIRKLNETDEHRRALLDQVQSLKAELKNRDENLRLVSREVEDTTRYVKRTREEFRQWQTEMDELRDRVKKLEDYRATLKPLIEETINQLDPEKSSKTFQRIQSNK